MKTLRFVVILAFATAFSLLDSAAGSAQSVVPKPSSSSANAGQNAPAAEAAKAPTPIVVPLAVGTAFNATLLTDLDARRNKAGDAFTAEITEAVRYQRSVILAKSTLLTGHLIRANAAGHGRRGSGLFLQFEYATLKSGETAALNAGIQAISAVTSDPSQNLSAEGAQTVETSDSVEDVSNVAERETVREKGAHVVETARTSIVPRSESTDRSEADPLNVNTPPTQGFFTKHGLFTADSQGVFGLPDVKLYTPLSQGSNGSVLLSTKKDLHLAAGTKLLLVIQPPAAALETPSAAPAE